MPDSEKRGKIQMLLVFSSSTACFPAARPWIN
jgi:hypothetical protein